MSAPQPLLQGGFIECFYKVNPIIYELTVSYGV